MVHSSVRRLHARSGPHESAAFQSRCNGSRCPSPRRDARRSAAHVRRVAFVELRRSEGSYGESQAVERQRLRRDRGAARASAPERSRRSPMPPPRRTGVIKNTCARSTRCRCSWTSCREPPRVTDQGLPARASAPTRARRRATTRPRCASSMMATSSSSTPSTSRSARSRRVRRSARGRARRRARRPPKKTRQAREALGAFEVLTRAISSSRSSRTSRCRRSACSFSIEQPCDAWIAFHEFTPGLRPKRSAWPSIAVASAPSVQLLHVAAFFVPSSFVPVRMSCASCCPRAGVGPRRPRSRSDRRATCPSR